MVHWQIGCALLMSHRAGVYFWVLKFVCFSAFDANSDLSDDCNQVFKQVVFKQVSWKILGGMLFGKELYQCLTMDNKKRKSVTTPLIYNTSIYLNAAYL